MTKSWFPDLIGPSTVAPNGGTKVRIRAGILNVDSGGVSAVDNPARRRTDLTIDAAAWNVITANRADPGEWLPVFTPFGTASVVRLNTVGGVTLTGLDSGDDPTVAVKYIANVGSFAVDIDVPSSPVAGKQYFASAYTLALGATVRTVWDSVTRVYRIGVAAVGTDLIILDGDYLTLDGDHILNPQV